MRTWKIDFLSRNFFFHKSLKLFIWIYVKFHPDMSSYLSGCHRLVQKFKSVREKSQKTIRKSDPPKSQSGGPSLPTFFSVLVKNGIFPAKGFGEWSDNTPLKKRCRLQVQYVACLSRVYLTYLWKPKKGNSRNCYYVHIFSFWRTLNF